MKPLVRSFILMFSCISLSFISTDALAWGQKGHDVTCDIAQRHLSRKASKEISKLLDGRSIVYWANWLDNASHTPAFAYTKTWHYKNIDADETYETALVNENGDVLTAIDAQIAALKSGELNKEAAATSLKMLVHLMGDLHCPMHMGHRSDLGGNRWQLQFFNNGKNLHSIWDTDLIESAHKWNHSEWADELDRADKAEIREITAGTPYDWGRETYLQATEIYKATPVGSKLSYDDVSAWAPTIEQQLLRGGRRLAAVLNDIFK